MTDIATESKASTGSALISLLYVARGLRGFGDGFAIIILPAYMTPLRQFDFREVGGVVLFGAEGDFLIGLDLVFGSLREPIPFLVGFSQ